MNKIYRKLASLMLLAIALPIFTQNLDAMQVQNEPKTQAESFWQKHKTKVLIASAVAAAIIIVGGTIIYKKEKSTQPTTGTGTSTGQPSKPTLNPISNENKEAIRIAQSFIAQYNYDHHNTDQQISGNISKPDLMNIINEEISELQNTLAINPLSYASKSISALEEIKDKIQRSTITEFEAPTYRFE